MLELSNDMASVPLRHIAIAGALVVLLAGGGAYAGYRYVSTELTTRDEAIENLTTNLESAQGENEALKTALASAEERATGYAAQVDDLEEEVDELDKLTSIDPQLLQKYSKVYFLNENYVPPRLRTLDEDFVFPAGKEVQVHAQMWRYLDRMLEDAEDDRLDLRVASGYRSFGTQADLKAGYAVTYGSGANAFSADQGYSEHQLGTTVDFTTPTLGGVVSAFANTKEYQWLLENAHRYGFILSYPPGNSYYQYEPWHWRFVGTDLARDLEREDKSFYDLDQRTLDEYRIKIFD